MIEGRGVPIAVFRSIEEKRTLTGINSFLESLERACPEVSDFLETRASSIKMKGGHRLPFICEKTNQKYGVWFTHCVRWTDTAALDELKPLLVTVVEGKKGGEKLPPNRRSKKTLRVVVLMFLMLF